MKLSDRTRMGAAGTALIAFALAIGLTVAGCGGSSTQSSSAPPSAGTAGEQTQSASTATPPSTSSSPQRTSGRPEPSPALSIEASIPGLVGSEQQIPKASTCDGANTSLPVRWSRIPPGATELAVFVLNLKPVKGKNFLDWAVTGLSPTSQGISAGTLPAGAIVARNSFGKVGYSICPPKGTREIYVVRVVVLPRHLAAQPGVDAEKLYNEVERIAKVAGITGGVYTRP
jgi:phosphatidylethanolamine-binding protein (PEBP) family uncharacterized protein